MFSPLEQFDVICVIPIWFNGSEWSLTNLVLTAMFVILIGMILFFVFFNSYIIPRTWQVFLEMIFIFIFRLTYQQLGKIGLVYFPFILALFLFILLLNLFSLLPFGFAVTSHLIWTMYFSLSICLGIFLVGIMKYKIHFLKLFVPEVPLLLYPLIIVLEIFSYIIRSFSLAIRLSANIISGHILVHIIGEAIVLICNMKKLIVILPFIILLGILVLELGIACLQAYIFITLMSMYLNDSLNFVEH